MRTRSIMVQPNFSRISLYRKFLNKIQLMIKTNFFGRESVAPYYVSTVRDVGVFCNNAFETMTDWNNPSYHTLNQHVNRARYINAHECDIYDTIKDSAMLFMYEYGDAHGICLSRAAKPTNVPTLRNTHKNDDRIGEYEYHDEDERHEYVDYLIAKALLDYKKESNYLLVPINLKEE